MSATNKRTRQVWSLLQLQEDIANDEEWHTHYRCMPSITKVKFYQLSRDQGKRLLVGILPNPKKTRVYAHWGRNRVCDTVELWAQPGPDVQKFPLATPTQKTTSDFLRSLEFAEPFDRLKNVWTASGLVKLRNLILFYFLEKKILDMLYVGWSGSASLKAAFSEVAAKAFKECRPRLESIKLSNAVPDTSRMVGNGNNIENKKSNIKQEPSPYQLTVEAPSNDSIRAVEKLVSPDRLAASATSDVQSRTAQVVPKDVTLSCDVHMGHRMIQDLPIPVVELKRKRSMDNTHKGTVSERPNLEPTKPRQQYDMGLLSFKRPEDIVDQCKQLAQDKRVKLQEKVADLQKAFSGQSKALSETKNNLEIFEKNVERAKQHLQSLETRISETSSELEEAQKEVEYIRKMDQGFESLGKWGMINKTNAE
ncbi:hypothetical protein NX059_000740 [Plenodomus lindquistii]|nr:hypothetical protein NX059_000740 [Plenodomus lindquistii]